MGFIKRAAAVCAILGGIAGSAVAFSAPAQAADCPAGQFCLYTGADGSGTRAVYSWGSPDLAGQGVADPGWVVNNSNVQFCLYSDVNYAGRVSPISQTIPGGFTLRGPDDIHAHSLKPC